MADFRTDTSAIKVDTPKGMSLADMLNIQKSSYELSKIKELYPAMIAGEQARSKTAGIESEIKGIDLERTDRVNKEQRVLANWASDPTNYLDQNGEIDLQKITHSVNSLAPYTGAETIKKYTELKSNRVSADEAKTKLTDVQRGSLGTVLAGLASTGEQDPKVYQEKVQNWANQFPTDPNAQQLAKSYISTLGYTQKGPQVLQTAIKAAQEYKGPVNQVTTAGGVPGTYNAVSNQYTPFGSTGEQPAQTTGVTNAPNAPTTANKPLLISAESPVRIANGVPLFNEQQKEIAGLAREEKNKLPELRITSEETKKSIDTALKTIKAASGNVPGQTLRATAKSIFGDAELEILKKSLADVTLRQAQTMGAGTDQAKSDVAKTQGNENLTVESLKSILERADATNTGFKNYTQAIKEYEKKRGIDHANANHSQFKAAWADNYDPNVFILQNIHDSNKSETEKKLETDRLFKGMSKENIKEFKKRANNIDALMRGDYK